MKFYNKDLVFNKKGNLLNFLIFFIFLISLFLLILTVYIFYKDMPGNPKKIDVKLNKNKIGEEKIWSNLSEENLQFLPNMKFNHNNISYFIDPFCNNIKKERFLRALNIITEETKIINFYEKKENPDIKISCSQPVEKIENKEFFIAGEGGAKEIIKSGNYYIIIQGVIDFYEEPKNAIKCDYPNLELHELMHVFGFNHSSNKNSLMYPYLESCNQILDESIIKKLKELYSEENLADLYFEDVQIIKKGRYLDFNLTIKNKGLVDAYNVSLSIFEEGKFLNKKLVGDINFGGGVYLEIKNLKLNKRNPKNISFVIDYENEIKELEEKNNNLLVNLD